MLPQACAALIVPSCAGILLLATGVPAAFAVQSFQYASHVLGQTDADLSAPSPVFIKGAANNGANRLGFNTPVVGIALDPTDHRLFLADTTNNRVLVYNLDAGNTLLDRLPDNVLGQSNFWFAVAYNTQAGMNVPYGLAFDDTHNRLFVAEGTGNRVKVFDVAAITDGENAVNVLGQPLFTLATAANTQDGLNVPVDVAYDGVNDRLFIAENAGNRVKVFDVASISDGEAAANVLGQAGFTTATAATTQTGMNVPYGLAYDGANQRLFVTESTGNRVTVYDVASISDGEAAANVLGQANFTATALGNTQAGMNAPRGLAYDATHGLLYVTQTTGNRLTTYNIADGIVNGENAVNVLGQANFTTITAANTQAGLNAPNGALVDEANHRLYVVQSGAHRVSIFDVTGISDNENAVDLLGQYDGNLSAPEPVYTKITANTTHLYGLNAPQGVAMDAAGHRLFVADSTNNRVLVYNLTAGNVPADVIPDHVLGQTNYYSNALATTQTGLNLPTGLSWDGGNNRLYVADTTNNRIVVYDTASITDGEGAVGVLGQANYTTLTAGITQIGLSGPRQIEYVPSTGQLFVADAANNRVIMYNVDPFYDCPNAVAVLGQDDGLVGTPTPIFNKGGANNAAHKLGFNAPITGIALDSTDHRLFLSDTSNHRVLVYGLDADNTLTDRVPDYVLGQTNFFSAGTARTQVALNAPNGLAYDDAKNRLFVVNGGSHRVTTYDVTTIENGEAAAHVLGQASFTAYTAVSTQVGMNVPVDVAYDGANERLFVAETTGNRVKVYNFSPGIRDGLNAETALGQTDSSLSDPQPIFTKTAANNGPNPLGLNAPITGLALDTAEHRLFLSDTANNRILVYNLDEDDVLLDRIPDNVLGQLNFHFNASAATQLGLETPNGLALSGSTLLFVAEGAGSRVKVYDVTSITNGEYAVNVLGQAAHAGTTAATTQIGMSQPVDLVYDGANGRLFVADATLNRVTVYTIANGITDGENAVGVLGQANFTTATAATTQAGMNVPYGLAYDGTNQRLFVAQGTGNRVTVYDVAEVGNGEGAVNVIGQTNFTNTAAANTQAGLNLPRGLAYDGTTSTLYVAEATGDRLKTFDVAEIADGENARNILGQANWTGASPSYTQAGLYNPTGALIDEGNSRLYVVQSGSHRVSVFDVSSISDNENAADLLGQYNDSLVAPGPVYTKTAANNAPNKLGLSAPMIGLALDPTGHRLFVSDTGNNRILIFNLDANDRLENRIPDSVLGQTNFYSNAAANTQAGLNVPNGIAFDDTNDRLFVTEGTGNRVKVFDVAAITDGENAANVLGQASWTAATAATTQTGMNVPYDAVYDSAHTRLFVAEGTGNRVKVYDVAGIVDNENAANVLGQPDFTTTAAATTQAGMNAPRGLAYDNANQILYVSQATGNRVTTYDVTAVTDGENAVNVLGQANFTNTALGNTQAGMNDPRGITLDETHHTLFVAQATGNRVTTYDVTAVTDGENAVNVLGQVDFVTIAAVVQRYGLSAPTGVLVDSAHDRLYAVDTTANRVLTYDLTEGIAATGQPAQYVLGQADWTAVVAATTQTGLNAPRGLAYDDADQILSVAQSGGNRVTVFDVSTVSNNEAAINVLGQTNFTNTALGNTQAGMNDPRGITLDETNSLLYVTQLTGNRVTVYNVAAITDGEAAITVLGQPHYTSIAASVRQGGLSAPNGVIVDEANDLLYVMQSGASRVSIFDVATLTLGEDAVDALGQFNGNLELPVPIYIKGTANNAPYKHGLSAPQGLAVDAVNHRLFVADSTNNRVLVYNLTAGNLPVDHVPDHVLGQPNYYWNPLATTQAGLNLPTGLSFDAENNELYVADTTNNRIVVYDTASITDGENAVGVLGQPSFLVLTAGITQTGLSGPRQIQFIPSTGQLFVVDALNNRVILYGGTGEAATDGTGNSFYFYGF